MELKLDDRRIRISDQLLQGQRSSIVELISVQLLHMVAKRVLSNPRQPPKKITLIFICEVSKTSQGIKKSILDQIHRVQLDTKLSAHAKAYDSPDPLTVNPTQPV